MMATCMERISSRLVADVIESVDSSSRWWLDLKICGFKLWMSIASPWMMIIIHHDPDLHIDPHDNDRAPVSLVDVVDVIVPEILGVLQHNVYLSYWEERWEFLLFRKLYSLKKYQNRSRNHRNVSDQAIIPQNLLNPLISLDQRVFGNQLYFHSIIQRLRKPDITKREK